MLLPRPPAMSANTSRRTELRDFLRTRRARLTPADVGLEASGRRRTPGLRREEVAVLAGVGVSWYTWLEQGREIGVSDQVLDAVARALRLDEAERAHLYRLAGHNPPPAAPRPDRRLNPALRHLLDAWCPNPAYLLDRHWDYLGVNDAAEVTFGLSAEDTNCLRTFFCSERYRDRFRYWEESAPAVLAEFRADAARYADDETFSALADELESASPTFAGLWERHEVRGRPQGIKEFDHPEAGYLAFEHTTLQVTDRYDLRLVLYTPQPQTATPAKLADLLARAARQASAQRPTLAGTR